MLTFEVIITKFITSIKTVLGYFNFRIENALHSLIVPDECSRSESTIFFFLFNVMAKQICFCRNIREYTVPAPLNSK